MSDVAVMSPEWAQAYRHLWNGSAEIRQGAKDLTMLIEWRVQDADDQVAQLEIADGEAIYGGSQIEGRKPDFVLTATSNVWHRVAEGEIGVASAIATRKIKFVGPIKVAMANMAVLSAGLRLVGQVDGLVWGD
ncbi:putative sterol carrier protein [uncultured Mycobacterium sp.]|jgi:putative sterol carrier protein|uniref:Sterol-binding protein n=2 Tax=Mycobacteriaceae TaxID=1762 RepID=A0A064CF13_9MYCO|nr:SCP2 sterol-binding domain-containing protein [Mycolicibacterium aromaticivorans]KDE97327.1 sterol-binding protein [Mycolicibacterium aromaticivorans JS19b1 = JCM 16368]SBS77740.1 putative sterol carrier protein [uncultured Mycobacterium sp.]